MRDVMSRVVVILKSLLDNAQNFFYVRYAVDESVKVHRMPPESKRKVALNIVE